MPKIKFIQPDWPAPPNIQAFATCRSGGVSVKPYDSLNLALHVGDKADRVEANRKRLPNYQNFQWLKQVHSNICVSLEGESQQVSGQNEADASCTTKKSQVCAVMTADCLPILMCAVDGTWVAAVHAGWRGLADGVIENTLKISNTSMDSVIAWLGPAISQQHFEVGQNVYDTFKGYSEAFKSNLNTDDKKYFADLYHIARQKLLHLGVSAVYGGDYCTYAQEALFFSHRRATHQQLARPNNPASTGRMVTAIYIQ